MVWNFNLNPELTNQQVVAPCVLLKGHKFTCSSLPQIIFACLGLGLFLYQFNIFVCEKKAFFFHSKTALILNSSVSSLYQRDF